MKLPRDVNGEQAVRALLRLGFSDLRQSGSHRILRAGIGVVVLDQVHGHGRVNAAQAGGADDLGAGGPRPGERRQHDRHNYGS